MQEHGAAEQKPLQTSTGMFLTRHEHGEGRIYPLILSLARRIGPRNGAPEKKMTFVMRV